MSEKALKHPSDHSDKGPAFLAIALVFTTLAFCLVLARVYVRVWVKHAFGWDDVFIILATVSASHTLNGCVTDFTRFWRS